MEQLREENKQLLQARDQEIAAREGAKLKLAKVQSDLAMAQVCYVCMIVQDGFLGGALNFNVRL